MRPQRPSQGRPLLQLLLLLLLIRLKPRLLEYALAMDNKQERQRNSPHMRAAAETNPSMCFKPRAWSKAT